MHACRSAIILFYDKIIRIDDLITAIVCLNKPESKHIEHMSRQESSAVIASRFPPTATYSQKLTANIHVYYIYIAIAWYSYVQV
jgi:hypothetical protein